jgi:hypothetical protein
MTTSPEAEPVAAAPDERVWITLLPELATLVVLVALLFGGVPQGWGLDLQQTPVLIAMIEGATVLLMWSLIDVATRLRAPPPWWLGVAIILGLLFAYPDVGSLLAWAWNQGLWVFLPVAWSVLERLRELWTLPRASRLEKLRRRALSGARVYTALFLGAGLVLAMLGNVVFGSGFDGSAGWMQRLQLGLLCAFYAIAAADAWRVHRPAFERRPRMLWRPAHDDTTHLDPL